MFEDLGDLMNNSDFRDEVHCILVQHIIDTTENEYIRWQALQLKDSLRLRLGLPLLEKHENPVTAYCLRNSFAPGPTVEASAKMTSSKTSS